MLRAVALSNPAASVLSQKRGPTLGTQIQKHLGTVETCFYIVEMLQLNAGPDGINWEAIVDDSSPPSFSRVDLTQSERDICTQFPLFPVSYTYQQLLVSQ